MFTQSYSHIFTDYAAFYGIQIFSSIAEKIEVKQPLTGNFLSPPCWRVFDLIHENTWLIKSTQFAWPHIHRLCCFLRNSNIQFHCWENWGQATTHRKFPISTMLESLWLHENTWLIKSTQFAWLGSVSWPTSGPDLDESNETLTSCILTF